MPCSACMPFHINTLFVSYRLSFKSDEVHTQWTFELTRTIAVSPPPSYYPRVETTGSPPHAAVNSHQPTQQPCCRRAPRSEIDKCYVQKFSRICAPVCQVMSVGLSMYFWNLLTFFVYLRSSFTLNTSFYFIGEIVLFVGGVISLLALYPAFKKSYPCMLTPFITWHNV